MAANMASSTAMFHAPGAGGVIKSLHSDGGKSLDDKAIMDIRPKLVLGTPVGMSQLLVCWSVMDQVSR